MFFNAISGHIYILSFKKAITRNVNILISLDKIRPY